MAAAPPLADSGAERGQRFIKSLGSTTAAPKAVWKGYVKGSLAAVAAGLVTHPIDLVKVRLQLAGSAGSAGTAAAPPSAAASAARPGILGVVRGIVRSEGVLGLYSGISGSVLRQTTVIGARLGTYEALKSYVAGPEGRPITFLQSAACGLAAGGVSAAVCNPADLALVRMQADGRLPPAQRRAYKHAGDALVRIVREEGVTALWRGTAPTVARGMIVAAAQMAFYDSAKTALLTVLPDTPPTHSLASLVAGAAAAVSSNPFDVVKTRLQTQKAGADGLMPYRGVAHCFAATVRTEGFLALYKGLFATWARQAPLNAVRFVALEQLSRLPVFN